MRHPTKFIDVRLLTEAVAALIILLVFWYLQMELLTGVWNYVAMAILLVFYLLVLLTMVVAIAPPDFTLAQGSYSDSKGED